MTPEKQAEEYATDAYITNGGDIRQRFNDEKYAAFIAGYRAAEKTLQSEVDHYRKELEESLSREKITIKVIDGNKKI